MFLPKIFNKNMLIAMTCGTKVDSLLSITLENNQLPFFYRAILVRVKFLLCSFLSNFFLLKRNNIVLSQSNNSGDFKGAD